MKRNKATGIICMLVMMAAAAQAQHFKYQTKLEDVPADGFYRIVLGAEVLATVKTDLRDLRIADKKNRFIPYIIAAQADVPLPMFSPLHIISNNIDTAGNTVLDIENLPGKGIDQISFIIKNTDVQRRLSISGSDDGSKWFAIREDLLLTPAVSYNKDEFMQSVTFPLSSYRYLRFTIRNNKSDALNIVRAGLVKINSGIDEKHAYATHPAPAIVQKDSSDGNSYIYIRQAKPNLIEQFSINVAAPPLYERSATLYQLSDSADVPDNTISNFILSSKSGREFIIPATIARHLLLVVRNGDNLPLSVSSVSLSYSPKTIIAYLEKDKEYKMLLGATDATPPNYDLEQFRDSIPGDAALLNYGALQPITEELKENAADNNKIIIWSAIVIGIGLVGFFTYRLVKEMNQNQAAK